MPASSAIARQWNFNIPITSLAVNRNGDFVAAALSDGSLRFLAANEAVEQPKEMALHNGVSLSLKADADDHAFLSGGDDGKVFIIDPNLAAPTLIAEHKNQWVDHVASSTDGAYRAYSIGKNVHMLNAAGEPHGSALAHPSSIGGLAFSPNSKRLAASHYNGVSLWWVNSNDVKGIPARRAEAQTQQPVSASQSEAATRPPSLREGGWTNAKDAVPVKLIWKSSHLSLIWHPDGKILLTSLQENALHGWRLSDNNEMRMQGYAAKIHSMSFTAKGKYLATSGAEQVICWPFFGGGPWGKSPLMLGGTDARLVTQVSAHPKDEMIAAGFEDGMIIMAPLDGRMEVMIHPPVAAKGSAVVGLVWNAEGDCLFAALESGTIMLFTIDSVRKAVAHA